MVRWALAAGMILLPLVGLRRLRTRLGFAEDEEMLLRQHGAVLDELEPHGLHLQTRLGLAHLV